jgi:hypothetical protein
LPRRLPDAGEGLQQRACGVAGLPPDENQSFNIGHDFLIIKVPENRLQTIDKAVSQCSILITFGQF